MRRLTNPRDSNNLPSIVLSVCVGGVLNLLKAGHSVPVLHEHWSPFYLLGENVEMLKVCCAGCDSLCDGVSEWGYWEDLADTPRQKEIRHNTCICIECVNIYVTF